MNSIITSLRRLLFTTRIDHDKLSICSHAILKQLLHQDESIQFFSLTRTKEEISMVLEGESLQDFPDNTLTILKCPWIALTLSLGSSGFYETGVISKISTILSKSGIPIFYLSTATSDYILVPYQRISEAIKALSSHPMFHEKAVIITEEFDSAYVQSFFERLEKLNQKFVEPALHEIRFTKEEYSGSLDCTLLPDKLILQSFNRDDFEMYMSAIIKTLFFNKSPNVFLSISETDDEISILLEIDSIQNFPPNSIPMTEIWKPIERFIKKQHNEIGVISVFSSIIANMNIPILYLSTFSSAFIILQESKVPIVEIKLGAYDFNVIRRDDAVPSK